MPRTSIRPARIFLGWKRGAYVSPNSGSNSGRLGVRSLRTRARQPNHASHGRRRYAGSESSSPAALARNANEQSRSTAGDGWAPLSGKNGNSDGHSGCENARRITAANSNQRSIGSPPQIRFNAILRARGKKAKGVAGLFSRFNSIV